MILRMNMCSTVDSFIQGKCISMCPEKEIRMRERNGLLHLLESVQVGKRESVTGNRRTVKSRSCADIKHVVKSYSRPAAGHGSPDPEDIRPPQVLLKTVRYLISEVVPSRTLPWNEVYDFVFDRLRAVRQDLVIQGTPSMESVEILEPIVRFLAYAGYRSDAVESALVFSLACYVGNYARALRCLVLLPALPACLAVLHLPHLRRQALRVMSTAYSSHNLRYPSAALADLFLVGSAAEVVDECRHYGLDADVDAGISFDKNAFDCNVRVRTPVHLKVVDEKLAAADVTKLLLGEAA